jgi:hypothetical protein
MVSALPPVLPFPCPPPPPRQPPHITWVFSLDILKGPLVLLITFSMAEFLQILSRAFLFRNFALIIWGGGGDLSSPLPSAATAVVKRRNTKYFSWWEDNYGISMASAKGARNLGGPGHATRRKVLTDF